MIIKKDKKYTKKSNHRTKINHLKHYHDSHTLPYRYFGLIGNPDDFVGIGFEYEIDTKEKSLNEIVSILINNNTKNEYFIEEDHSLKFGCELITQPHTFESMYNFINNDFSSLLKQLDIKTMTQYATIHFHVSKKFFGTTDDEQINNVAKIAYLLSFYSDKFQKFFNRFNTVKCKYLQPFNKDFIFYQIKESWYDPNADRYMAINVKNKNTVEFRMISTTTDIDQFKLYYQTIIKLINRSLTIDWNDVLNLNSWFAKNNEILICF